ncbi:hypothetical protein [Namhaeicola litoreus]|uniref:Leishmanolysin n=1 Tax=Namhaeicola litoreus TaxID=1052145 RepID=A0ABW3XYV9_9FLAO
MKKNNKTEKDGTNQLFFSIAFGSLFMALLLTSCSNETLESDTTRIAESEMKTFDLIEKPNELIRIESTAEESDNIALKTTTAPGDDKGRFNITLKYLVPVTERQREVFESAVARWERIIIKDVPSFTGTVPSAFRGFPPAIDNETADDIVIEVVLAPIDGPGRILGQAGPRFFRTSNFLTLTGVMFFDVDDLDFLESLDLFEEVIVHEMGHVLGVGTLWNLDFNFEPFNFTRMLRGGTESNPYFTGRMANVHWNAEGGTGELPIEGDFGPGTRFSHWDEATLNNELMTGFLNLGENPLSRITAGSLRDLGYGTAVKGESYDLPKGTPGIDINEIAGRESGQGLNIAKMEEILEPIGYVTAEN